jgi:hypothetical protein
LFVCLVEDGDPVVAHVAERPRAEGGIDVVLLGGEVDEHDDGGANVVVARVLGSLEVHALRGHVVAVGLEGVISLGARVDLEAEVVLRKVVEDVGEGAGRGDDLEDLVEGGGLAHGEDDVAVAVGHPDDVEEVLDVEALLLEREGGLGDGTREQVDGGDGEGASVVVDDVEGVGDGVDDAAGGDGALTALEDIDDGGELFCGGWWCASEGWEKKVQLRVFVGSCYFSRLIGLRKNKGKKLEITNTSLSASGKKSFHCHWKNKIKKRKSHGHAR